MNGLHGVVLPIFEKKLQIQTRKPKSPNRKQCRFHVSSVAHSMQLAAGSCVGKDLTCWKARRQEAGAQPTRPSQMKCNIICQRLFSGDFQVFTGPTRLQATVRGMRTAKCQSSPTQPEGDCGGCGKIAAPHFCFKEKPQTSAEKRRMAEENIVCDRVSQFRGKS